MDWLALSDVPEMGSLPCPILVFHPLFYYLVLTFPSPASYILNSPSELASGELF